MTAEAMVVTLLIAHVSSPDDVMSLPVTLTYLSGNPYAVTMDIETGDGDIVSWIFARELLVQGAAGFLAGFGDVRVNPASDRVIPGFIRQLTIELSSGYGRATIALPITGVEDFLRKSYKIYPAGHEHESPVISAELDAMLFSD